MAAAPEVAGITARLLGMGLMLFIALLILTVFLGVMLWARTVKPESVLTPMLVSATVSDSRARY